jgi:hypothetical protein
MLDIRPHVIVKNTSSPNHDPGGDSVSCLPAEGLPNAFMHQWDSDN